MGTILAYRNDGFCEIALDNGERIQMHFNKNGLLIERHGPAGQPADLVFEGDAALASAICVGLADKNAQVSPLNLLAAVVQQLPSAAAVRTAFAAAAQSL
jgi:hypothetical protein